MPEISLKNWWASKTIWAGIIEIVAGILTAISVELSAGATLTVLGIVTIVLRAVTSNPLGSTKKVKE